MSETTHAVLLDCYEELAVQLIADAFVDVLGMLRFDALRQAEQSRGLVAQHLSGAEARALRDRLASLGVESRVIEQGAVVPIARPSKVRCLEVTSRALGVVWGYVGEPEEMPWDRVFLISAGEIEVVETHVTKQRRARRDPMAIASALTPAGRIMRQVHRIRDAARAERTTVRSHSYGVHLADIMLLDSAGEYRPIRLNSRELYYGRILGDNATRDFFDNFRLVVGAIAELATRAGITPETEALLALDSGGDAAAARFGEEPEFTQYNRWLLQRLIAQETQ